MGITGLHPFLEKSSRKTNISEFSGGTVAIDVYCWLHKGAFSCADKLIMGQDSDLYVNYCMKFINMLLSHNIKPILVFDGRYLPAKAETESKRRQCRQANVKRAADLIRMGKIFEGKNLLRRALDVSHKMALKVIKECQARNIDCIVAPYEADAQLAYLNISGIADVVITEDSDLTLFGCKKIMFKMDLYGRGVLVEQERLHLAMGLQKSNFHMDKFRYMCILSGCDYLASLPGIGLVKACKFIVKNTDDNIYNALVKLQSILNMKSLVITKEYRDDFMRALVTFKHQLIYCPLQRKQVRLTPPTTEVTEEQLKHAGTEVDEQLAWELALGNCDPFTYEKLHDFNPDVVSSKLTNAWSKNRVTKHISIWSKHFKVTNKREIKKVKEKTKITKNQLPIKAWNTCNKIVVMKTESLKNEITPRKRTFEESEKAIDEIVDLYRQKNVNELCSAKSLDCSTYDNNKSPILVRRSNPFRKTNEVSPSLVNRLRRRLPVRCRLTATVIDETAVVESKFFSKGTKTDARKDESMEVIESTVTNAIQEDCKQNISTQKHQVLPETEINENEVLLGIQDSNKDSGYKESSDEKDMSTSAINCNDLMTENKPFHIVHSNPEQKNLNFQAKSNDESMKEDDCIPNSEEEMEFSISSNSFLEHRSSMFKTESSVKSLKKDGNSSQTISRNTSLLNSRLNVRKAKSNLKRKGTIQGQQSLLTMFGYKQK